MDREHPRPAIRVAVAAPFPEIVRINESAAEFADELEVCAMISSADSVLEQARLLQPDVLLLSEGLDFDRTDTLTRLSSLAPGTRLVVVLHGPAAGQPVMADAVVRLDATPAELRSAILAAAGPGRTDAAPPAHARTEPAPSAAVPARRSPPWLSIAPGPESSFSRAIPEFALPQGGPPAQGDTEAGEAAAAAEAGRSTRGQARTVLVFSGKGGVGKSVVATNLATALAVAGARVALVDLNLQYGDVGVLLHLEGHPVSIETVAQLGDHVDPAVLDRALATSADGVRVLLAPSRPESSDLVSAASVEGILNQLSRSHDYVIVDSPPHLEERVVGVMEVADHILLITSFGITSVKDTKMTLRLLQSLGIERDRVAVLLNQTRPRMSLPAAEIERALSFPVLTSFPHEPRMDESLDSGRPLIVNEPRSGFSRQLRVVVDLVGRPQDPAAAPKVRRHASRWRLRLGR